MGRGVIGLALACALALAACGRTGAGAAPAPAAAAQTTITALIWAPDWPDQMQQVAAEFMRLNPDVRVKLELMQGNSVEENIRPRIASHDLPDLMSVNPNAYAATLAEQGVLADVGHTAAWAKLLPTLKSDWVTQDGRRFGIAGGVAATLIYYNKTMFKAAGIERLPTDFGQFLDVCERLKRAGFTPIFWAGGVPNIIGNAAFSFGFANNVVATTPDWKARIADGTLNLANGAGADIFAKIRVVAQRGYTQPDYMHSKYDDGINMFAAGKTAMAFQGTWASGRLMSSTAFETGVMMPPWNDAGSVVVPVIGSETGFAVCKTPRRAVAIRFLEFITGPGFAIQQNKRHNISPFRAAPGALVTDARLAAYLETIEHAPVTGSPYYSMLPANTIDMLHPLIQEVLSGKTTPRQAAQRLDASLRAEAIKNRL